MSADNYTSGWHIEGDALVRRLTDLEWAPVPDELRERCWEDFERRIAQNGDSPGAMARSRAAFNVGERYEMRRFAPARRLALAERGLVAPGRSLASSARIAAAQVGGSPVARRAFSLS